MVDRGLELMHHLQSRAAALQRHNIRETGRFTSQANLREAQKKLLAPSSRWRKEWVKPGAASGAQSSYKIMKWVKYDEGGENAEDSEQPTEEQVTAAITGARTLLEPPGSNTGTPAPAGTGTPSAQASSSMLATVPANASTAPSPAAPASESQAKEVQPESTAADAGAPTAPTVTVQEEAPKEPSLQPGVEDDGGNMQVEMEQREHDVRLAPELVGTEAEETRAALGKLATAPVKSAQAEAPSEGISDPIQGGPPEVTG